MKRVIVISLGGSLIIPEKIDFKFLNSFKKTLQKNYKKYKFVVVCGGGVIARKYISALRQEGKSKKELAEAGIRATRMNARFMMQFFGKDANNDLPTNMKEVKNNIQKNNVVFSGTLRYDVHSTTDGTAAKLSHHLKSDFINMTNVKGLYTNDPKTDPKAKFISKISWKDFNSMTSKIKFHAGQSFALDQNAAVIIKKHKIRTYIIGSNKQLKNLLKGKKFIGTTIAD